MLYSAIASSRSGGPPVASVYAAKVIWAVNISVIINEKVILSATTNNKVVTCCSTEQLVLCSV